MVQADYAASPELNPLSLYIKDDDDRIRGEGASSEDTGDLIPEQRASIIDESATVRYYKDATRKPIIISDGLQGNIESKNVAEDNTTSFDISLSLDVTTGCGGKIWPAAEVLGQYIASKRSDSQWRGKIVLELGSGTGLVGLLAAEATQLSNIWITDQIPMMALMRRNLALNSQLGDRCTIAELNWGAEISLKIPKRPDVLLLADCVYLEIAFQPLVNTMMDLSTKETEILRRKVSVLYLSTAMARKADLKQADKRFFKLLRKHFTFQDIEDDDPIRRQEYNRQGTKLLRVYKMRD